MLINPYRFGFNDPLLTKFITALGQINSRLVRVVVVGDSITGRYNATTPTTQGYDVLLRNNFAARYNVVNGGDGFYPLYNNGGETQLDSFFSKSVAGLAVNDAGPFNCQRYYTTGEYCEITVTGRYLNLFYQKTSFGTNTPGQMATYQINGGTAAEFGTFAATYTNDNLIIDTGAVGTYTLRINGPSGAGKYVAFWGLEVTTALTGLVFWNLGWSGTRVESPKINSTNKWTQHVAPDLLIWTCNTNDASAGISAASFDATIRAAITEQSIYGSLLMLAENPRGPAGVFTYQQGTLVPLQVAACSDLSCKFVNVAAQTGFDTLANQLANGYCIDTVHPTTTGHAKYNDYLTAVLP